jgi:hypothetical protein
MEEKLAFAYQAFHVIDARPAVARSSDARRTLDCSISSRGDQMSSGPQVLKEGNQPESSVKGASQWLMLFGVVLAVVAAIKFIWTVAT